MLPPDLSARLQNELGALAQLDGTGGVAPGHLRFCVSRAWSCAAAQAAIRDSRSLADGIAPDTAEGSPRRLRRGDVHFERRILEGMLADLLRTLPAAPDTLALQLVADAARFEPELLERMAAAAAFGEHADVVAGIAQRLGAAVPALRFVGRLLAEPFMIEGRRRRGLLPELDARSAEGAEAGRCPSCASAPALALLCRDDGRRRLLCGLCGDTWLAPRLMCVACGERDPSRLATLRFDEADARWIEACNACRHYLKTLDEERLAYDHPIVICAEEAASLHLDLLAEASGYAPPDHDPQPLGIAT